VLDTNSQTSLKRDSARPSAGRFCVLVNSSDRARDVFEIVFQNAEAIWRNCDWPRFAGFTTKHPDRYGFKTLAAKKPSDWRGELSDHLDSLPGEIEYVLRLEEDTLFLSPVSGAALNAIADLMVRDNLFCVRLAPVRRNIPGRVIEYVRSRLDRRPLRPLSFSEPYYSSLDVAIWKRSYLRELLQQPVSIWDFEHIVTSERHYAVWKPVLDRDQIVTKGGWSWRARRLLARQGLSLAQSKREFQTFGSWLRGIRQTIIFETIGYLSFRIRKRLNRLPRVPKELIANQPSPAFPEKMPQ
jgi:hypothetical protein